MCSCAIALSSILCSWQTLLINDGTLTQNLRIILRPQNPSQQHFRQPFLINGTTSWQIKYISFTGQSTCPLLVFLPAPNVALHPSFHCSQNSKIKLQWFPSCNLPKSMPPWELQSGWIVLSSLNHLNEVVTQHGVRNCSGKKKSKNQVNKATEQIRKHLWDSPLCT